MQNITFNGRLYSFVEEFDVNLTLQYENDSWSAWHIIRELVSNALDSVSGDASKVHIREENGYVFINDEGTGYPLTYAKRIGATTKSRIAEASASLEKVPNWQC